MDSKAKTTLLAIFLAMIVGIVLVNVLANVIRAVTEGVIVVVALYFAWRVVTKRQ